MYQAFDEYNAEYSPPVQDRDINTPTIIVKFLDYIDMHDACLPLTLTEIYNFLKPKLHFSDQNQINWEYGKLCERSLNIYNNKYKSVESMEYMHIYRCLRQKDFFHKLVTSFLGSIEEHWTTAKLIYETMRIMSYTILFCNLNSKGDSFWFLYSGGIWRQISFAEIVYSTRDRLCEMGYDSFDLEKHINTRQLSELVIYFNRIDIVKYMDSMASFVMDTMTFDTNICYHYTSLPTDFSTRKSNISPDYLNLPNMKQEIIETMVRWLVSYNLAESALDMLGIAIGRYDPREAWINYGTGNEGKSSFILFLLLIFGTYAQSVPVGAFSQENKDPNAHTAALNNAIGARILYEADSKTSGYTVCGYMFKCILGGDEISLRKLFGEYIVCAIKALIMINTNRLDLPMNSSSDKTRYCIYRWVKKYFTSDTRGLVPTHMVRASSEGEHSYHQKLASSIGKVFLAELIMRRTKYIFSGKHHELCEELVKESQQILEDTPLYLFLSSNVLPANSNTNNENTLSCMNICSDIIDPSIEEIFAAYGVWVSGKRNMGNTYIKLIDFKIRLELHYPLKVRKNDKGRNEDYIEGVKLISTVYNSINSIHGMPFITNPNMMLSNNLPHIERKPTAKISTIDYYNSPITNSSLISYNPNLISLPEYQEPQEPLEYANEGQYYYNQQNIQ